ncbi:MAG: amidohydrolase family protein, partial [Gemmatimonadales bacterium]
GWDADMEVVRSLMGGGTPAFFAVDYGRDIQRVLKLAEEYDFRPIIVGGAEAWKVADALVEADVPVLVSLDFPEPERWQPESDNGDEEGQEEEQEEEEELDAAALREKQRIEDSYANAGRLAEAGVRIALTSGGGKADILAGARKAIEYGLSEQDALSALTATPASLFGIGYLARVHAGGPATFVVTDAPIFDEEMKILYVFVEGALEEGREPRAAGEEPAVDMTGTWDVDIDAEGQSIAARMTVTQEGADFEGTMTTPFGEAEVRDGLVSGNDVSFTIVISAGGETMEVEMTGTVEGDRGSGSGDSPDGSFTWSARRTGGPGEEN